jgi:O-antigen ligase
MTSSWIGQLARRGAVPLLLALVMTVPLLFPHDIGAWRSIKPIALELLVLALVGLAGIQAGAPTSGQRLMEFIKTGPNQPILMLVLLGAVSWYRSPAAGFSQAEWIRLACCAGLYFAVALRNDRRHVRTLVGILLAASILTSIFGLVAYGQSDQASVQSSFGNSQLYAGFLLIQLPLLLILAFADPNPGRKIVAQVAAALAIPALLLAQTRSAWIGAIVGLVALAVMLRCFSRRDRSLLGGRHQMIVPLAVVLGAGGLFLLSSRSVWTVQSRASTLAAGAHNPTFAWRIDMWQSAWELIRERPLFGWGIGTYPLEQARTAAGRVPRDLIQLTGPTLAEEAHNEYLQLAAEMGLLGLGLYLWMLVSFFAYGVRELRRREDGFRKLVLMGCVAGVAAQAVDALSNPAWRFADVSFLLWLMMGLGIAAVRATGRSKDQEPVDTPLNHHARSRLGWRAMAVGLTLLAMSGAWARRGFCPLPAYNSAVNVRIEPSDVKLHAGECVQFRLLASTNNSDYVDVTDSPDARFTTNSTGDFCLTRTGSLNVTGPSKTVQFCAAAGACSSTGCGNGRLVPVYGAYGQSDPQAHAVVTIVCP